MEKLKLLIIEDSALVQGLYGEVIDNAIFEIQFADDGQAGLHLYQQWQPDIILLDMVMPVMTGYSFLKEVRQRFKDKGTAIIVQTSLKTKEDVVECAKLGIQGYIVKPPDFDTITQKILECYATLHPERAKAVRG